jgi:hypothetical protein
MLAACSMTFSRDRPKRLLELSGTEAPTLDEETIFVGQRNGFRHDARLLLRSRRQENGVIGRSCSTPSMYRSMRSL